MADASADGDVLRAPPVIEFPFSRTVGPVQGAFLTGRRGKILLGVKRPDGSVLCPPGEYDPDTSAQPDEMDALDTTGTASSVPFKRFKDLLRSSRRMISTPLIS